jgi:hypothetical protein
MRETKWDCTAGLASPMQLLSSTASQVFSIGNENSAIFHPGKVTISLIDVKVIKEKTEPSMKILPTKKQIRKKRG